MIGERRNYSLKQFARRFATESVCRAYLFKLRWPDGFVCPVCGSRAYYRLPKRELLQCKNCSHQTSVTAGTIMHRTRTPLRVWFWAMYLTANDKRGLSALQLSKKLKVSYYVAWTMLHKIRQAMKDRDAQTELAGLIQVDQALMGGGPGGDKKGRGSKKTRITVQASIGKDTIGLAKMSVAEGASGHEQGGSKQRGDIPNQGAENSGGWLRVIVSNARSFLLGTYHGIGSKHLQRYLDEFCYRFNRRRFESELFDRLATACANSAGITYSELTI